MPQKASIMAVENVCREKHEMELRGVEIKSHVTFTCATTSDGITPGNSQLENQLSSSQDEGLGR